MNKFFLVISIFTTLHSMADDWCHAGPEGELRGPGPQIQIDYRVSSANGRSKAGPIWLNIRNVNTTNRTLYVHVIPMRNDHLTDGQTDQWVKLEALPGRWTGELSTLDLGSNNGPELERWFKLEFRSKLDPSGNSDFYNFNLSKIYYNSNKSCFVNN